MADPTIASVHDTPKPWPHGPTRFERRFGNNVTRIVVAVVAIPLILAVVFLGGWWFALLVAAMSTGALLEFYWMLERREVHAYKWLGIAAGVLLVLLFAHGDLERLLMLLDGKVHGVFARGDSWASTMARMEYEQRTAAALPVLFLCTVLVALILALRDENRRGLTNLMGTLTGFFYVSLCMATLLGVHHLAVEGSSLLQMRSGSGGADTDVQPSRIGGAFVLLMFVGIWTCDSFAYFGGRAFGRHKLFERVSPKKTWEGAIAGAIAGIAVCVGLGYWLTGLTWYDGLFIGIAAGVFGQIGDLAESHLKRACGVKDSSQIIPGHGGILDRFDSLLFVAPPVYIYLIIVLYW